MSTIELCDLMLSTADAASGEVRVNIGNTVDGTGFGAAVPMWGVDGFLSRPNAAAGGKAAQGLYLTQGNSRRVFASRDTRWAGPFGPMGEGDRALVSDCDAGLHLARAANTITLASASNAGVEVGPAAVTLTFAGCTVTLAAGALTLAYAPSEGAPPVSTIVLSAAGVAITGTAVTVNGIPIP